MAASGNLGGKIPAVDDVLLSHKQETYPTNSLVENCIDFEYQLYRNDYVVLLQSSLGLRLRMIKRRGYETYNLKILKTSRKMN